MIVLLIAAEPMWKPMLVCWAILTCIKRIRCPAVRLERGHPATFSRKRPFITWIMGFLRIVYPAKKCHWICFFTTSCLVNFFHFCLSQRCWWPIAHPGIRGVTEWNASAGVWMCCVGRVHPRGVRPQYQMPYNLTVLHKVTVFMN